MPLSQLAAQLRTEVTRIALPDGRIVGSSGHARARRDLVERLTELALEPYAGDSFLLPYEADGMRFCNVIATLPGSDPTLAPVLIAAHYDTAGVFAGADDNAAAMAIALTSVAPLRARRLERSVVFAFFDAEEPPYFLSPLMGSIYFYHHQRRGPIHCAFVMDLVGHDVPIPGHSDLLFLTGMESDPALANLIEETAPAKSLRIIPTLNTYVGDFSDHHVFRVNQRPYFFFTCAHWPHYHRPTDTPEKLNYNKMAAIQTFLVDLAARVSQTPLEGPFESSDTAPTEAAFMKKNLGQILALLNLPLETRQDIDQAARLFITQFGL